MAPIVERSLFAAAVFCAAAVLPTEGRAAPERVPESHRYGFVNDHVVTTDQAIQRARDAGFGWVKYLLFWNVANPTHTDCNGDGTIDGADTCNFDWSLPDAEIQRLADAGLNIYVHFAYPPTWTTGATYPNEAVFYCYDPTQRDNVRIDDEKNCRNAERRPGYRLSPPPGYDRSGDLRLFVDAAVRRYKDRVRAWGFGAEIHSRLFWQGSWMDFFDEVLVPVYDTVKAVDPALLVVGPEEDQVEERPGVIGAFEYLIDLETARGRRVFDILSFHFLSQTFTGRLDDLDTKIKPLIERTRKGRPFWLTEFGYGAPAAWPMASRPTGFTRC